MRSVEDLVAYAIAKNLSAGDLEEIIALLYSRKADSVNIGGLESQISALVVNLGANHTKAQIDNVCCEKQKNVT